MLSFICDLLANVGSFIAQTANVGCAILLIADEPECPSSLID